MDGVRFRGIDQDAAPAGASPQIEKLRTVDDLIRGTPGRERLVTALSMVFGVLARCLRRGPVRYFGVQRIALNCRGWDPHEQCAAERETETGCGR